VRSAPCETSPACEFPCACCVLKTLNPRVALGDKLSDIARQRADDGQGVPFRVPLSNRRTDSQTEELEHEMDHSPTPKEKKKLDSTEEEEKASLILAQKTLIFTPHRNRPQPTASSKTCIRKTNLSELFHRESNSFTESQTLSQNLLRFFSTVFQ